MKIPEWVHLNSEVRDALDSVRAVVALESTLIAHGLPFPTNIETARESELAVRRVGAIPATIAIWRGRPTVGLSGEQLEELAETRDTLKASRRDIANAMSSGRTAATTVSATMFIAHAAGIRVFATGGIGGVHRYAAESFDISADLGELARTPVLVVCAGAKSILDLPKTLEMLETLSVPVIGYRTSRFPAFYVRDSGGDVSARVESPAEAARWFATHRSIGNGGALLCQPVTGELAFSSEEFEAAMSEAEQRARAAGIQGPALTPFLLAQLADITAGRSLATNRSLIVSNAALAGQVAVALRDQPLVHGTIGDG